MTEQRKCYGLAAIGSSGVVAFLCESGCLGVKEYILDGRRGGQEKVFIVE